MMRGGRGRFLRGLQRRKLGLPLVFLLCTIVFLAGFFGSILFSQVTSLLFCTLFFIYIKKRYFYRVFLIGSVFLSCRRISGLRLFLALGIWKWRMIIWSRSQCRMGRVESLMLFLSLFRLNPNHFFSCIFCSILLLQKLNLRKFVF